MENKYEIQWRVETLSQIALTSNSEAQSFLVHGIRFSNWEKGIFRGSKFWIAKGCVTAPSLNAAIVEFYAKLKKIIPKISLISQCYIEFPFQPFLVKRTDKESAYFRYFRASEPIGLLFDDQQEKVLKIICKEEKIPEAFYFYWNDAVNTIGYSSKFLLMCAALEAVAKVGLSDEERMRDRKAYNRLFYPKIKEILGQDQGLMEDLYGTRENGFSGLRQRLTHGEYFRRRDSDKDYVDLVHQKIIQYLNNILQEELLFENVVDPQRHIWGNKEGDEIFDGRFIKAIGERTFDLKEVLSEADKNGSGDLESYEYIYDGAITTDY
ncbi:MAG: hypothetical protein MRJ67_11465 [Nitrospirales bacterium]|nr:hypothetical protein [Nitrospirales bacterium]